MAANANAQATSLAAINKAVASIARSADKLNESIHNTAIMCMQHAFDYGDCNNTAAKLVDAMPKSHRRNLLINWFAAFSPIAIAKDGKTDRMKAHLSGKQEERVWNIEAAKATPFYAMPDAQREPDVPTYESIFKNVSAYVARMKTQAEKIANDDEREEALKLVANLTHAVPAVPAAVKDIKF